MIFAHAASAIHLFPYVVLIGGHGALIQYTCISQHTGIYSNVQALVSSIFTLVLSALVIFIHKTKMLVRNNTVNSFFIGKKYRIKRYILKYTKKVCFCDPFDKKKKNDANYRGIFGTLLTNFNVSYILSTGFIPIRFIAFSRVFQNTCKRPTLAFFTSTSDLLIFTSL